MIKQMRKEKKEMLMIGISYLICIPRTESRCFTNGTEASPVSWSSRSPFPPSYHPYGFAVVVVWDWSPLTMNEVSHSPGGDEVEMPSPLRTILIVGPERPICFASVV
jgi:hypothetical protein